PAPRSAGVHRRIRHAVRVLYARHDHELCRTSEKERASHRGRDSLGLAGKYLPLRNLSADRGSGPARGAYGRPKCLSSNLLVLNRNATSCAHSPFTPLSPIVAIS